MWWTLTTNLNLNREDSMMGKILIDSEQEPRRRVHAYASESQISMLRLKKKCQEQEWEALDMLSAGIFAGTDESREDG